MKYFVTVSALTLMTSGISVAGTLAQTPTAVPAFTPWGTVITAVVLGAAGLFTFFRKGK